MDADGSNVQALTKTTDQNEFPAWSPNGQQIAFTVFSTDANTAMIMVMNADGSNAHPLTDKSLNAFWTTWSPDGKQVAFFALPANAKVFDSSKLYVVNTDGTPPQLVVASSTLYWMPSWSPDGKRIAFAANRDGKTYQLYSMNPAGSDIQPLTNNQTDIGANSDRILPVWSPDGKQVAFLAGQVSFRSAEVGKFDVYVMDGDGSHARQLTKLNNVVIGLAWSPDGKQIAFLSGSGQQISAYVMDTDGSNVKQLTKNNAQSEGLSWIAPRTAKSS